MLKRAKYVCLALLLVVATHEIVIFTWAITAEHKAKKLADLVATLRPGYTTKDSALALFQAQRWDVRVHSNVENIPNASSELLAVSASNYPRATSVSKLPVTILLTPLPPVRPAEYLVSLYFRNGVLNSMHVLFVVGTTRVSSSRYAENQGKTIFRSSEWRYSKEGMVVGIGELASGSLSEVPWPNFEFKYMYSLKCVDARMLWPTAPPRTTELHGGPGCR